MAKSYLSKHWMLAICLLAVTTVSTGCARKFTVSVNQQTLYDPRALSGLVQVADAGLQSCINLLMRQQQLSDATQIRVIACPVLQIETLEGIQALSGLRFVDVSNNLLSNLDPLRQLGNLSSVNAPNNQLQDISGILNINSLTSAVLSDNPAIPCDQLELLERRLGPNLIRSAQCQR
jgi:Leucine-rich repeat (LRR) protein